MRRLWEGHTGSSRFAASLPQDRGASESVQGGVNFSSFPLKGGEGLAGLFAIFIARQRLELLGEVSGNISAEYSQGAEERVRGTGEVAGAAAGDGAADFVEKPRRVFVEERDHPPHEDFVAIELIEQFLAAEDRQLFRG